MNKPRYSWQITSLASDRIAILCRRRGRLLAWLEWDTVRSRFTFMRPVPLDCFNDAVATFGGQGCVWTVPIQEVE